MEPAERHPSTPPLEPVRPSATARLRGAAGLVSLTVALGITVAISIAVVIVVLAVLAITLLG